MMKIVISKEQKDKLEEFIFKKFDDIFPPVMYEYFWSNKFGPKEMQELGPDVENIDIIDGDMNSVFRIILNNYFPRNSTHHQKHLTPILSVEYDYTNKLNGMFGNNWKEPLKRWIKQKFPSLSELEINTII